MDESVSQPATPSPAEPVPAEFDLLCEGCGYSLIGLVDSNRCPECGKEFDPNDLPLARVPWLYRARLGKFRAYWRTVWYVLRNPAGFAAELCRPVRISASDAAAFRRRTIRIACLSVVLPIGIAYVTAVVYDARATFLMTGRTDLFVQTVSSGLMMFGVLVFAGWAFFTLGTDLPTFIWKGMGETTSELAPIHHYAAAPLATIPIFVPFIVGAGIAEVLFTRSDNFVWAWFCLAAAAFFQVVMIGRTAAVLMRGATRCGRGKQAGLLAYLTVHWSLIAFVSFLGSATIIGGMMLLLDKTSQVGAAMAERVLDRSDYLFWAQFCVAAAVLFQLVRISRSTIARRRATSGSDGTQRAALHGHLIAHWFLIAVISFLGGAAIIGGVMVLIEKAIR